MYDFERSLVKKYQGRPFALIGVNSDDPASLADIISQRGLTWNSFKDGRGGPIAMQWKVMSYPTLLIIDDKGIIRERGGNDLPIEEILDRLVSEAEHK